MTADEDGNAFDYDLFVIGGGSGGVRAARMAAGVYGARVGLAESGALGGTCVNVGCVPKKLFWYASHVRDELELAAGYGWSLGEPQFDWAALRAAKDREIERLNGIYAGLLEGAGVTLYPERAELKDQHTVAVGGAERTAKHIVVATGGRPRRPELPGAELGWVSDDVFYLERLPASVVVVGGGYIGVELAGVFFGLGVAVDLVYRGSLFLRGFDDEVRLHLAQTMRDRGLGLHFNSELERIEGTGDGPKRVVLQDGRALEADAVLFATGRDPNTDGLGLGRLGVELDRAGKIVVDRYSRTSVGSIWAIGDVTDQPDLTPVAIHEGACLARTLFTEHPTAPEWEPLATAVFSQPPIGSVGWTEEQARERCGRVETYCSVFRPLKLTLTEATERALVKVIVECETRRVVGVHVVGPDAPEIVQGFAAAIRAGITKDQLDATVAIHPTTAEELVTLPEPVAESNQQRSHQKAEGAGAERSSVETGS